ncbi:MAG: hypothetical protein ACHREM_03745 [Polyangiales bacterium]
MRIRLPFASLLLAATLVAIPALADTITHKVAMISIDVPDNWKSEKDGDLITLTDKHEDVAVAFIVVDSGAVKSPTKAAKRALKDKIKNLTFKDEEKVDINGMEGHAVTGDGTMDGKDMDLAVLVLDTPNEDKDLVIIALAEDAKLAKHMKEVQHIFKHLKPMK